MNVTPTTVVNQPAATVALQLPQQPVLVTKREADVLQTTNRMALSTAS